MSNYQTLINDPAIGDKQLDGSRLTREAVALYREQTGQEVLAADLSDRDRQLLEAQLDAMREVVDEQQASINRAGIGFKGFVPAVFARLANEKFGAKAGEHAQLRVTAPETSGPQPEIASRRMGNGCDREGLVRPQPAEGRALHRRDRGKRPAGLSHAVS